MKTSFLAAFCPATGRFRKSLPAVAGLFVALNTAVAAPPAAAPPAVPPSTPPTANPGTPPSTPPPADPASSTPAPAPPTANPGDPAAPAATPPANTAPPAATPPPAAPAKPKPPEVNSSFAPHEVVKLEAGGTAFEGLFRETTARQTRGAIIMLHGRDSGANDLAIVDPLRVALPDRGWSSLSLVLPEAKPDPVDQEKALAHAEERVKAGVEFLKGKDARTLILLGHDLGARVLVGYLTKQADPAVKAAVVIDPVPMVFAPGSGLAAERVARVRFPLLDLRTGRDTPVSEEDARAWRVAFRGDPGYRQSTLNDPHADWKDMEEFVRNRIHGWLVRLQKTSESAAPTPSGDDPAAGGKL